MTFGGLSAGGEWRKKRPGKWLKWREGFFRVSGVSSFHTIHTVSSVVSFVGVVVVVVIAKKSY